MKYYFLGFLTFFAIGYSQSTEFLEIASVKGNVSGPKGKDQINALSFNHGVSMPMTTDRRNQHIPFGEAIHQDFRISKYFDASSPVLKNQNCLGSEIKFVKCHLWTINHSLSPREVEWATITLEDCFVASIS